ncbi:MAG: hypothetical protein Kow0059_10860 [Candidatus Sumerlaeia bacterium]
MTNSSSQNAVEFKWGEREYPASRLDTWRVGPLVLWGRGHLDELWLATHHFSKDKRHTAGATEADGSLIVPEPPDFSDTRWGRWVLKTQPAHVYLRPVFPPLPVVVKTEYPFCVTPNAQARIYVRVPVWVSLETGGVKVTELPTAVLSQTWFGDPMGGELCYWISSSARREIHPDPARPHLAICPILIVNESREDLAVEKICLRVPGLTMFIHDHQLWSDETTVKFRGPETGSVILPSGRPPGDGPSWQLIATPRFTVNRWMTARTFATLMEMKGLIFPVG